MPSYIGMGAIFMDFLLIFVGFLLFVLFFANIKSAALFLCRVIGGFVFLILFNTVSPLISLSPVGANIVSALICGVLEIPGAVLLILLNNLF